MARTFKRNFLHDWSPGSRRREYDGWAISADNPFVVFKTQDGKWSVGHSRSGSLIDSILPPRLMRSKLRLLMWLEDMERAEPEAVAMFNLIESPEMTGSADFREYGQRLIEFSRGYECL